MCFMLCSISLIVVVCKVGEYTRIPHERVSLDMIHLSDSIHPSLDSEEGLARLAELTPHDLAYQLNLLLQSVERVRWANVAEQLCDRTYPGPVRVEANRALLMYYLKHYAYDDAKRLVTLQETLAVTISDRALLAAAQSNRGIIAAESNDLSKALVFFDQAIVLAHDGNDKGMLARYHSNRAMALERMGHLDEALMSSEMAASLARNHGTTLQYLQSSFNHLWLQNISHERTGGTISPDFFDHGKRFMEECESLGDVEWKARTLLLMASTAQNIGNQQVVADYMERLHQTIDVDSYPELRAKSAVIAYRSAVLGYGNEPQARAHVENVLKAAPYTPSILQAFLTEILSHTQSGDTEAYLETCSRLLTFALEQPSYYVPALSARRCLADALQHEHFAFVEKWAKRFVHHLEHSGLLVLQADLHELHCLSLRRQHRLEEAFDCQHDWVHRTHAFWRGFSNLRTTEMHRMLSLDAESRQNAVLRERTQQLENAIERERHHLRALEELQAQRNDMIRLAVHDIKGPLGDLRSLASLVPLSLDDRQELSAIADMIIHSTDRLLSVVESLSLRNQAGNRSPALLSDAIDMRMTILRIADRYRNAASAKDMILSVPPPPVDVFALGDATAVDEIIDNIVNNAIKFCSAGDTVTIVCTPSDDTVVVSVQDNGPGLSADDQQQLFVRRGTLGPRPTAGESSTGSGLFLCARLATRMNGSLTCLSNVGTGSTFSLRLPRSPIQGQR